MSDKNRFKRRRELFRARGLCERCGRERARPGHVTCKKCVAEIGVKKMVRPALRLKCERIGRVERNLALFREAVRAAELELDRLRAG